MKTLYIVRHAKSSWDAPEVGDFERPLNERGKRDAPRMGKRLKEKRVHPDLLLTSGAKRAYATAKHIAEAIDHPVEKIKTDKKLYHASEEEILSVIRETGDKHDTLMIFGHNPGLTDFVNALSDKEFVTDNIPTCGIVAFEIDTAHWKELSFGKGRLLFFDYPKSND